MITIDSDALMSKRPFFVGTDNCEAGRTGAEVAARQMQNKRNVVVFTMPEQINLRRSAAGRRVNGRCQPPETESSALSA